MKLENPCVTFLLVWILRKDDLLPKLIDILALECQSNIVGLLSMDDINSKNKWF